MIEKNTFEFLKKLAKNNNKPWFDSNRATYEIARENIKTIVTAIIPELANIDKAIGEAELEVKNCMFRINRDIRFSKEKHPYKINMGMQFNAGGKNKSMAGYYIHVQPGACFVGGGVYMPMPPELKKIRQEIDYNLKSFEKIVKAKAFTTHFEHGLMQEDILSRPPKGYDDTNPALPYLKLKHFVASKNMSDESMTDKSMVKEVIKAFKALQPMIAFLNTAMDGE